MRGLRVDNGGSFDNKDRLDEKMALDGRRNVYWRFEDE
jgi:hypothetical protein